MAVATASIAARAAIPVLGTVICAVDASTTSRAVLYAAAGLAAHPESQLIVVRVGGHDEAARIELTALVQQAIPGWMSYRQQTEIVVRSGEPAQGILDTAREYGANLIVMGTHGRGPVARFLCGSVVESVLRRTAVPVAVVPPSGPELISLNGGPAVPHIGSILVPIDLKGRMARQLAFASTLSLSTDRELTLLHVIPDKVDSAAPLQRLRKLAATMDAHAGVRAVVTHGPLVSVIVDRQLQCGAGVVVLGRDARAPGRIARELLQKTRAVVIFVP